MSTAKPLTVYPGLLERSLHFIDFMIRNRPGVSGYRLWVSTSIENAYGNMSGSGVSGNGGVAICETRSNVAYMSRDIVRTGRGVVQESLKGMTRFYLNPSDFMDPANPIPSNEDTWYVRLQEEHTAFQHDGIAGHWLTVMHGASKNQDMPYRGPILVMPPTPFYCQEESGLTLAVFGPKGTGASAGALPPLDETLQTAHPLYLVLPKPSGVAIVKNLSLTTGDTLLYSTGPGIPMIAINPGEETHIYGGVHEILLASGSSNVIQASVSATVKMNA